MVVQVVRLLAFPPVRVVQVVLLVIVGEMVVVRLVEAVAGFSLV